MAEVNNVIDSLYSKLLLRDFFGKIVPGTIVILTVAVSLSSLSIIKDFLVDAGFALWLLLIGASWIVAFSVQSLGEFCTLIRYHRKDLSDSEYYKLRHRFNSLVDDRERMQLERIVVIKEACGNGCVALLLSVLILLVDVWVDSPSILDAVNRVNDTHVLLFVVGVIVFLGRMHFVHVTRAETYMRAILDSFDNRHLTRPSSGRVKATRR
jgi:hypothetical protein